MTIKRKYLLIIGVATFLVGSGINTTTNIQAAANHKESKIKKKTSRTAKINKFIAERLEEDHGFAMGTLDENAHPTENGIPNQNFYWSIVVKKITYNKNNHIKVYTTSNFKNLSEDEKNQVAIKSQNAAMVGIGEYKNLKMSDYRNGAYTSIICDDNFIGHSKMLDSKDFKWR